MKDFINRQFDRKAKIAIVGDTIIDEYYYVEANRISPEFPIPVLKYKNETPDITVLGGAGNVANQFSKFNFDISFLGIINEKCKSLFQNQSIENSIFIPEASVPIKKRFYNNSFPLCRLDVESENYGLDNSVLNIVQEKIIDRLNQNSDFDVVVFSDYNKGLFKNIDQVIPVSISDNCITIVDPKDSPISRWKNCSIIKPNAEEARVMSGTNDWRKQCSYFQKETNCTAVIITQAGNGVVGNIMGNWFEFVPEHKKQPNSVIGAGDCFVAFLAMCMAHSIDIKESIEIAFDACSIYVQNHYNNPIYPYQVDSLRSKFVDVRSLKNRDFSLCFTNGCFDILHSGHLDLLKFAKSKADKVVVALNSDDSVARQNKDHKLVNTLKDRKQILANLEFVDFVVDFEEDTPYELIKIIEPDALVKGADWKNNIVGSDLVKNTFCYEIKDDISTTKIIQKIKNL